MQTNVLAPKTSLTAKEVTVTEWRKKVGDRVRADEVLLVVETEKATVDVLAPADGVLFSIRVAAGETAEVSSILAVIDDDVGGEQLQDEKRMQGWIVRQDHLPVSAEVERVRPEDGAMRKFVGGEAREKRVDGPVGEQRGGRVGRCQALLFVRSRERIYNLEPAEALEVGDVTGKECVDAVAVKRHRKYQVEGSSSRK